MRAKEHLTRAEAENLVEGFDFAAMIGMPLDVAIDINWRLCDGDMDDQIRRAHMQERLSKWAERSGFSLNWLWVRELSAKSGGAHTHILAHIPPFLVESGELRRVVIRTIEPEGRIIYPTAVFIDTAETPRGKLGYILKGLHPDDAQILRRKYDLDIRPRPQGVIAGKRSGLTENIGNAARARYAPAAVIDFPTRNIGDLAKSKAA